MAVDEVMPALDDAWIAAELAICEENWPTSAFFAHARTGYPAALKALQEAREAVDAADRVSHLLKQVATIHDLRPVYDALWAFDAASAALAKLDAPEEAQG